MKEKVTASRSTRLVQLKCHLNTSCDSGVTIEFAVQHYIKHTLLLYHAISRNEFAYKDYTVPLKHWKMPCTFPWSTLHFACSWIQQLFLAKMYIFCTFQCVRVVWVNDHFPVFSLCLPPFPSFCFYFFLSLQGFLLPLSHAACELRIFCFV